MADLNYSSESDSDSLESASDNDDDEQFILETESVLPSSLLEDNDDGNLISTDVLQALGSNTLTNYVSHFKAKAGKAPKCPIHPVIAGLIGQANMSFVKGDYKEALTFCEEVLRIAPDTSEVYQTMSEIYDEFGEHYKALQLGMVAAATGQKEADKWVALGYKALDLNKRRDAIFCYRKAIKCNRELHEIYLNLIKLYDTDKEKRHIIFTYQSLVKWAPVHLGGKILEFAQTGAQILLEDSDVAGALDIMEKAFERVPESITVENVNLIVELYLQLSKFEESLQVISKCCNVTIEGEKDIVADSDNLAECTTSPLRVTHCQIHNVIPAQIRAKLAIVLIHLKAYQLADDVIEPLLGVVEEYGDLLVDIIEVFISEGRYAEAIKLLQVLIISESYQVAQVWWLYANCLKYLGRKEEAVSAYLTVMDKAPQHADARLIVSELLNELGRDEEALTALSQDPNSGYLDIGLLYERCNLLKHKADKADEFLAMGRLLLSRHCARFRSKKDFTNFIRYHHGKAKPDAIKFDPEEPLYIEGKKMPTSDEEYELFLALCNTAFEAKQYHTVQRITCSAMGSKLITKNPKRTMEVQLLAALACYFNKDSTGGHVFFKYIVANGYDNCRTWNLYNILLTNSDTATQQKFIIRFLSRKPSHFALPLIFANNCFTNGIYKQALSEYLLQFKHEPTPFLALMIAITCLHLAMQNHRHGVNALIAQSMGFMSEYKELRGPACLQEVHYNLGRLNHQLGLLPPALHHYKQVLEISAPHHLFDLKREAAFNISLIYQKSQSFDLARYYIDKYIVI